MFAAGPGRSDDAGLAIRVHSGLPRAIRPVSFVGHELAIKLARNCTRWLGVIHLLANVSPELLVTDSLNINRLMLRRQALEKGWLSWDNPAIASSRVAGVEPTPKTLRRSLLGVVRGGGENDIFWFGHRSPRDQMLQDERASVSTGTVWAKLRDKLKEPSLVAATTASISCLLLILLLATRWGLPQVASLQPDQLRELKIEIGEVRALVGQPADQKGRGIEHAEFEQALTKATEFLNKKDFAPAYDFLLVASRLSATDPRLFDAALNFIGQAKDSPDDDVVALADDLLDRCDSLVHFQSPKSVESARQKLTKVREGFSKSRKTPEPESKSEPIRRMIQITADKSYPVEFRSKVAERARHALDEARMDLALSSKDQGSDLTADEIKQLQKQTEEAEKRCVVELFERYRASSEAWLKSSRGLIDESKAASPEALPGISERIAKALGQGMDRLQEVVPYAKSEVEGAQKLSLDLEKQIKQLQRLKTWLYNQQALRLIREVESNKSWEAMGKLKILAGLSEDLLSPYVMQRFSEVWEKVFESLGDEDKKVEAVRLRILRANE